MKERECSIRQTSSLNQNCARCAEKKELEFR